MQSFVGQRRGRSFLVGYCPVRVPSDPNPEVSVGLTCSFSHEKIMEMECELLISSFRHPKTIALVKENIGRISDGSSSHCAGALKLGLKKAAEFKKQQKRPPGVQLRCKNYLCGGHSGPIPYSSVGVRTYCPRCKNCYYMQCFGCGYDRKSSYASCQNCGKNFV